jgi:hypothetical protein
LLGYEIGLWRDVVVLEHAELLLQVGEDEGLRERTCRYVNLVLRIVVDTVGDGIHEQCLDLLHVRWGVQKARGANGGVKEAKDEAVRQSKAVYTAAKQSRQLGSSGQRGSGMGSRSRQRGGEKGSKHATRGIFCRIVHL